MAKKTTKKKTTSNSDLNEILIFASICSHLDWLLWWATRAWLVHDWLIWVGLIAHIETCRWGSRTMIPITPYWVGGYRVTHLGHGVWSLVWRWITWSERRNNWEHYFQDTGIMVTLQRKLHCCVMFKAEQVTKWLFSLLSPVWTLYKTCAIFRDRADNFKNRQVTKQFCELVCDCLSQLTV